MAASVVHNVCNYSGSGVADAATVNPATAATAVTSFTLTPPATPTSGNLLWVAFMVRLSGATITPPTGWTQLVAQSNSTVETLYVYWKIATASEPSSYAFSWGTNSVVSWSYREITGQNGTTASTFLDSTANSSSSNTSSAATQTTTTVTPTNDGCLLLVEACFGNSLASATVAAGGATSGTWTRDCLAAPNTGTTQPALVSAEMTQTTAAAAACAISVSPNRSAAMYIGGIVPAASGPADPFPAYLQLVTPRTNPIFKM